jgi:hypothetical protein
LGASNLRFSEASHFPTRQWYGALGIAARTNWNKLRLTSEAALTDRFAIGIFTQATLQAANRAELTTSLRYFGANFDNPHTGVYAAADETFGSRARNERGWLTTLLLRPLTAWNFATLIDVWQPANATLSMPNIRLLPQIQWRFTDHERWVATLKQQPSSTRLALEVASQRRLGGSAKAWHTWRNVTPGFGFRLLGKVQIAKRAQILATVKYEAASWTCYASLAQHFFDSVLLRARYEVIVPKQGVLQHIGRVMLQYLW